MLVMTLNWHFICEFAVKCDFSTISFAVKCDFPTISKHSLIKDVAALGLIYGQSSPYIMLCLGFLECDRLTVGIIS